MALIAASSSWDLLKAISECGADAQKVVNYRIVEGRICIWLRYLATVRRAMRMP